MGPDYLSAPLFTAGPLCSSHLWSADGGVQLRNPARQTFFYLPDNISYCRSRCTRTVGWNEKGFFCQYKSGHKCDSSIRGKT